MGQRAAAALVRAVRATVRFQAGPSGVFREAMRLVSAEVPNDGWCGLTLDPATLMMTGGVHEHGLTPGAIRRLLEIEHGEHDVHSFAELARARRPTGTLSEAEGPPEN